MNKELIKEIINDLEQVSNLVSIRLKQLYELLGETPQIKNFSAANNMKNQIKESIEKQRDEVMSKMEQMRQQALAQVQESIKSSGNMNGFTGNFGGFPTKMSSPKDVEELRKKITKDIKNE